MPVSVIVQSPTLDAMALSRDENFEDGAYAADARGVMRQLPEFIRSAATDIFYRNTPPAVFLIGATRFLGPYILHEILDSPTEARVIAHVLAEDAAVGLNRLESTMKAYGLWSLAWINTSRLEVVIGDISKPQLGLCQNFWHRLLDEVDIVVHNGAQANWMLPYSRLQAPNVLSTMACVRFCAFGKPKRLAFVSSTSTLDIEYYIAGARYRCTGDG